MEAGPLSLTKRQKRLVTSVVLAARAGDTALVVDTYATSRTALM